jgi:predicted transcriptional regulator
MRALSTDEGKTAKELSSTIPLSYTTINLSLRALVREGWALKESKFEKRLGRPLCCWRSKFSLAELEAKHACLNTPIP